jgi:hypothetical protein
VASGASFWREHVTNFDRGTVLAFVVFATVIIAAPALADPPCDAVLRYGVFDEHHILNLEHQYRALSSSVCSNEQSLGIDFKDESGSFTAKDVCNKKFDQFVLDKRFEDRVRVASQSIIDAWESCINKATGLSHYISTDEDPSSFSYHLKFNAPPDSTKIQNWSISVEGKESGVTCGPAAVFNELKAGRSFINSQGLELDCHRDDPTKEVKITLSRASRGVIPPSIVVPALQPDTVVLRIVRVDDTADCVIHDGRSSAPLLETTRQSKAKWLRLPNHAVVVTCNIYDETPNNSGGPSWNYEIVLERDGVAETPLSEICDNNCTYGATNGHPHILVATKIIPVEPFTNKKLEMIHEKNLRVIR